MKENPAKPVGDVGAKMLERMNISHAPLRAFGLHTIEYQPHMTILDVGCGGGATIKDLLKLSKESVVYGLDYASKSIEMSSLNNKEELNKRVFLKKGDVAHLPYEENMFDLVTAVETVYFWPDITKGLEEIHRVLKKGGHLNIICEGSDPEAIDWPKIDGFFKIYRPSELQALLVQAHFQDVVVHHGQGQYISVVGVK